MAAAFSSSTVEGKMIKLRTSDGEEFDVEEAVDAQSKTIRHMIEDGCGDDRIPLPIVTSNVLSKVLEYCRKHAESSAHVDELKSFDADLVKLDYTALFDLILAANYLDIKELLDLVCQTVAGRIKDKTVEEVRVIFNEENDFTPEDEAEIRMQNEWASL